MDNLKNISEIVIEVLKEDMRARNSDSYLYLKVCEQINPQSINHAFWFVMVRMTELGLPKMETVRRARQKVQHDHPELAGSERVREERKRNEEKFKSFARNGVV